jgi:hypothetical protein
VKILCASSTTRPTGMRPSHNPNKQHTSHKEGHVSLNQSTHKEGIQRHGMQSGKILSRRAISEYSSQRNGTGDEEVETTKEWRMKRNRKRTSFQQITAHDGRRVGEFNLIEEPSRGKSKKET